jgi:methylthioribulose-1-phosphate dehydratase
VGREAAVSGPRPTVDEAVSGLIDAGRFLAARGLVPATSGNLSCRVSGARIAITASGPDKGALVPADILLVDEDGPPHPRASAETALHLRLYRDDPDCGAVLHAHSPWATLLSMARAGAPAIAITGYELLKAFAGVTTHEATVEVPLFPNRQDVELLAAEVAARLAEGGAMAAGRTPAPGYLLEGHGLYAWGRTLGEARRHVEAMDFLLRCEWERSRGAR